MSIQRFTGIPYKYGAAGFDGCDCWGLVQLWYDEHELKLPIDTKGFYEACPTHESVTLRSIWKLKGPLKEIVKLEDNAIVLGYGAFGIAFGIWEQSEQLVLMTTQNQYSRLVTWQQWTSYFEGFRILSQSI